MPISRPHFHLPASRYIINIHLRNCENLLILTQPTPLKIGSKRKSFPRAKLNPETQRARAEQSILGKLPRVNATGS